MPVPDLRKSAAVLPAVMIYALLTLYVTAAVSLRVFPTQDGAPLLYSADVARSLMHGDASSYHSYFALGRTFMSHVFFLHFFGVLGSLFDLLTAEKIFVALYLACAVFSFRYLVRSLDGDVNSFVVLLVLPFAANVTLYLGFYDYCIGVPAALFVIGYWLRCWKQHFTPFRWVAALLSIVAAAAIHQTAGLIVLVFIAVHLALGALAIWRERPGSLAISSIRRCFRVPLCSLWEMARDRKLSRCDVTHCLPWLASR